MDTLATLGFRADTGDLDKADRKLKQLATTGDATERKISGANDRMETSFKSSTAAVTALVAGLGALGAAASISQIMKYSDQWTSYNNVLRQVTNTEQEFLKAQKDVLALAKQTNSNLQSTAELYGELSRATSELGLSSDRVLGVVGTINKLFLAGGKSAEEASGSIRQLSQALGAGALRGDEFNSVAEGAPRILDALAKQLNMTRGELREFAATGGITAEIMVAALESYSSEADKMVAITKRTFAQTSEVINANITQWVGSSQTLETATQAFSSAALSASENIEPLLNSVIAGATVMGGVWVVSAGQAAAATYGKIKADLESIAASNAAAIADKAKAVASAQAAIQEIALSKAEQAASISAISSALQQITAEQQLEAVRMKAQISEIGRIHTATRMAELGKARAIVTTQLTAAEASLLAIETKGAAATSALTAATGGLAAAQSAATLSSRALGAAVAFMTGPWGILLTTVGAAAAAFYATSESQSDVSYTSKNLKGEIDALTGSIKDMSAAQRESLAIKINERLVQLEAEAKALKNVIDMRKGVAGFDNQQLKEFSSLIGVTGLNAETLSAAATHSQAALDGLNTEVKALKDSLNEIGTASSSASKGISALDDEYTRLQKTADALDALLGKDLFAFGADKAKKDIKDTRSEFDKLVDTARGIDSLFENGLFGEAPEKTKKQIKEVQSISEKAAERIESAFADVFINIFDGFESVVDGMKNAFKRMLAEMAHMALTRPIMVSLGMGGMLPGAANAATGAASGLGLLGGVGSSLIGAGGMLGGAFGGGLAGAGGLISAGNIGGLFSGAGSLFGSGNIMAGLGMSMPLIAGAVVAAMGINKLAGGGLFGTSYKTDSQSLGLSLAGGDVSGLITTEESRKKSLFRGTKRRTSTGDFDASAIDLAFDQITDALSQAANTFGITGADEIIKGFAASVNINIKDKSEAEVQAAIEQWIGDTTGALVNAVFGNSLEGLQKEGEGVIDTVNRLSMNMGAVQSITKALGLDLGLTGKAAMIASTNIVELAGGIDQLAALSSQYYQSFYSDAERQADLQKLLAESFSELNLVIPASREEFRAYVDALDLTTEAGQSTFAALMQLVPGMDQYLSSIEAMTAASEDAARAALEAAEAARAEAEAKAKALKEQGLDLQLRLYDALGQSSEALALRRQMELEATDESLRAMLQQIYAAQDAATAQRELADAQNAAAEAARNAASAAIDAAQSAFSKLEQSAQIEKDRLATELDLKLSTIEKEREALELQRDSVIDGYREQGRAVADYVKKLEGLSGVINDFLGQTGAAEDPFKRLTQIFSEVKAGLLPEQGDLQAALSGIAGAGSAGFGSSFDQQRAIAIARNQAMGIGSSINSSLAGAKSQVELLEISANNAELYYNKQLLGMDSAAELAQRLHDEQVLVIDEQLSEAQKQLNVLLGVDDRILTMSEAAAEFYEALGKANDLQFDVEKEQLAAINAVEAAVLGLGLVMESSQLTEFNKPDDRIWLPPVIDVQSNKPDTQSEEVKQLLKEILQASKSNADHTSKSASLLQEITIGGIDTRVAP